tara:strand:+ start:3597 stop:6560 length:2964 start_codon:yes stop_codon:yes gene_type:complete
MAKIEVQILDYENSVLGTLDITDSENFPLALTYLISDGRDLESRFGDFSKSFDVPATKNNNKLFDNIYNSKIDDTKDIVGLKDCRILVDSIDFFKGKIQVKGNKQSSKPLSYSCTIFGGNYGWLSKIKNRNVCDTFDKHGELIKNGNFATQVVSGVSGDWIEAFGSPGLLWTSGSILWFLAIYKQLDQDITSINNQLTVGNIYEVSFEIKSYGSGSLEGSITNSSGDTSVWSGANNVGVWSYQFILGDAGTSANLNRFSLNSGSGGFTGSIDNVSLKEIKTIQYTKTNIISSWTDTQATNDIVYPLINYGRWINPYSVYIQGYNLKNSQKKDMRPSWYIYNLLVAMFRDVGYTISSNFIENADFKKLICHFPPDVDTLTKLRPSEVMVSRDFWNQDSPTGGSKGIWDSSIVSTDYQVLSASNANSITNGSDTDTGWMTIKNDLIVSDINGDYNSSTGQWTCSEGGSYDINSISCLIIGNFTNNQTSVQNVKCRLKVYARIMVNASSIAETTEVNAQVGAWNYNNYLGNGATTASSPQYPSESKVPILNAVGVGISNSVVLNTGDVVSIDVRVKARSDSTASNVRWGVAALNDNFHTSLTGDDNFYMQFAAGGGAITSNTFLYGIGGSSQNTDNMWSHYETPYLKITATSSDYVWGKSYKYSDLLPCNISQVNFIKGIAHLFNLQFRTDPNSKIVYIEPFNDFYKDKSLSYDWTDKLDLSKEIEDDYNIGLNERVSFQYKNDGSDGLMKYINDSFKEAGNEYNFYNYFEELGENYNKGITKFENPVFSSTWNDWDVSVKNLTDSPPLLPVINKSQSLYGWDLLYMNSWDIVRPNKMYNYNPRILLYQGYVLSPNDANLTTGWQYSPTFAGGVVQDDKTPRATFVDWDNDSGNRFTNLSFNDEIIQPPTTSTATTVEGLYSVYWKNMIEQLKANPRIRSMYINLNSSDIATLDLSKLVYINGSYWRINKVVDYAPLKNITTKVEFIQWI